MAEALKERKDVEESLTWDLSAIYKTEEEFQKAISEMKNLADKMEKEYKGNLNDSKTILKCLEDYRKLSVLINDVICYTDLAVAVDYTNDENVEKSTKTTNMVIEIESRLSFIDSEIIENSEKILDKAISESKESRNYLNNLKRRKAHTLNKETEKALKALQSTLDSPYDIYEQSKNSDIEFESFKVGNKEYPLGYAMFENEYEYENNTEVRRAAYKAFYDELRKYQNTNAAVYRAQVQKEKTLADLRGFDSIFDSLLFEQKVDRDLYDRQIDIITEKLAPVMRKYAKLIKRVHNLDEMTFADLKISVDPSYDPNITIEESKKYIVNGLSVLGDDYAEMVKRAYDERWVDFAQNKGKSTGGFCAWAHNVHSYILLSWTGKMAEVLTLAHELGHAGHFKLAGENNNFYDLEDVSGYFVEAPSTMNELLMENYLLTTSDDKRFRRWVLSCMITNTYYHNFITHLLEAAYQREVYKIVDNGGSVQASTLNKIKREVLEKFWGEDVKITDGAELTWMRQPHYYMGLYSYTYSAGLTIGTEVSRRILKEGQKAVDDWKNVLRAGGTKTPVELAKMAGVDITTDKPLLDTINYIESIVDEIIKLTDEIEEESK